MVLDTKKLMAFWFSYPITFQTFCLTSSHKFSWLFRVDLRSAAQTPRRNPCWGRWCLMLRCRCFAVEIWMSNSKHPHVGCKVLVKEHQVLCIFSKGRFSCAWFLTEIGNQWKHLYVCNEGVTTFATLPIARQCVFSSCFVFRPAFTWSFRSVCFVELEFSCLFVCLIVCLVGWLVDPTVSFRSGSMAGSVTASAAVSSSLAASAFEAPDLELGLWFVEWL